MRTGNRSMRWQCELTVSAVQSSLFLINSQNKQDTGINTRTTHIRTRNNTQLITYDGGG